MRALHTAASGMAAQELNVQVISNNIANMRTTGYKRQRAEFQDLLYQQLRRVGTQTSDQGNILPAGIELGAGVKTTGTPRVMTQGALLQTGKDFDVAILCADRRLTIVVAIAEIVRIAGDGRLQISQRRHEVFGLQRIHSLLIIGIAGQGRD